MSGVGLMWVVSVAWPRGTGEWRGLRRMRMRFYNIQHIACQDVTAKPPLLRAAARSC